MEKDKLISSGILEQYILGLTSPEEDAEIEQAIVQYPEVEKHLEMLQQDMHNYSIDQGIQPATSMRFRRRLRTIFNGIALVLIIALAVLSWRFQESRSTANKQIATLKQELFILKEDYNKLSSENKSLEQQFAFLKDTATHMLALQRDTIPANMIFYWNAELKNAFVRVGEMPAPPEGHSYQLWSALKGKFENLGLLQSLDDTATLHPLDYTGSFNEIYVTVEKEGGADSPSLKNIYSRTSLF